MNPLKNFIRTLAAVAFVAATGASAQTFSPELRLVNGAGPSLQPTVAAVGSNVYVAWIENFPAGVGGFQGDVMFARSTDGGVSFSGPVVISGTTPTRSEILPIIAAGGTQVQVFWTDSASGDGQTYHARSTNFGTNFSPAVAITTVPGSYNIAQGALVDANGNVHLAFYSNRPPANNYGQIFYQCSADAGFSFPTPAVNITGFDGQVDNESPRFAQGSDGTLYMNFRSTREGLPQGGFPPFDQYLMRTTGPVTTCGSVSWLHPVQKLTRGQPEEFANTYGGNIIAGAGDVLHLTYWSGKLGTNLWYRRGFPNGKGWETPVEISAHGPDHLEWDFNGALHMAHGLGVDAAGKMHAVFGTNDHMNGAFQVGPLYYRCSDDGITWANRTLATTGTETAQPRGFYADNKFHMVWMDFRDNNFGAEIYYRNVATGSCSAAVGPSVLTDLNGDGRSDLLYRNTTTGQIWRFFANGFSLSGGAMAYTEPNTAWKVIGDADFNDDGVSDLLWRNSTTGQIYLMPMSSGGLPAAGGAVIYNEANAAWRIIFTPDLNGDGKADILWRNTTTGQVYAQLWNGTGFLAQAMVYTEPNTAWVIEAVGDFAGSGKQNQLVYRNTSTGQVYLVTVNFSSGVFSQTGQTIYQSTPPYKIVASADFNGDGKSDLLWRNPSTGALYMMLFNGPTLIGEGAFYTEPNLAWKVVSVGDYSGDGKADILWRNDTTGQVYMMLMNGLAPSAQSMVYTEPNTAWKLLGPWEYAQ